MAIQFYNYWIKIKITNGKPARLFHFSLTTAFSGVESRPVKYKYIKFHLDISHFGPSIFYFGKWQQPAEDWNKIQNYSHVKFDISCHSCGCSYHFWISEIFYHLWEGRPLILCGRVCIFDSPCNNWNFAKKLTYVTSKISSFE